MSDSPPMDKRIGILGGSFDPIHLGHLIIAQDAVERLGLSEVIFVPAAIPPHKQHVQQADTNERLAMLQLAVESDPRFSVSGIEVERGGVSYTIDTIRALKRLHPGSELILIVGSDTLLDLHNWYQPEELLSLCRVATVVRPGEPTTDHLLEKVKLPAVYRQGIIEYLIEAHQVEISSTEIRKRVAAGLDIRYFVPQHVEQHIYDKGLYKGHKG